MSEEDWEGLAEKDEEAIAKLLEAQNKFSDEHTAPIVPEPAPATVQTAPKAAKKPKKNIGEEFEKKNQDKKREAKKELGFEEKQELKRLEEKADHELTEDLFDTQRVEELLNDQNYMDYAGEVSRKLTHGHAHYKIPVFFKELLKDVSSLLDSNQIHEIMSQVSVIHSEKLKQEKGPTKKKANKKQPVLKGIDRKGKLMQGGEEEEEETYDEYGDFL